MDITVLYGTETGNAEMLAEDIQAELEGGHDVDCTNLSDFAVSDFDKSRLYLIVCSTYGEGELPASAHTFVDSLTPDAAALSGIHFAMFGLGDMEYEETYNGGSRKLVDLLKTQDATQIGRYLTHDASGPDMAEDVALPWAAEIVTQAATLIAVQV